MGKRENKLLTVMSIRFGLEHIRLGAAFSKNNTAALNAANSQLSDIVKGRNGTIVKGFSGGLVVVYGDKKSDHPSVVSACLAANDIIKLARKDGLIRLPFYVPDDRNAGAFRDGYDGWWAKISIVTGNLDVEYERDSRYPIRSVKGDAIELSRKLVELIPRSSRCIVDPASYEMLVESNSAEFIQRQGLLFRPVSASHSSLPKLVYFMERGSQLVLDLEPALLPIPPEEISEPIPPASAVPNQAPMGLNFGGDEAAPIRIVEFDLSEFRDTEDQREGYQEIKEKALEIHGSCGSSNALAKLKANTSKLVDAMGNSLRAVNVRPFWSQMNSLRHQLEVDRRVRSAVDPDCPPLPENIAGLLSDLVDTLNVFAAYEPKLIELDELKRDPAERLANSQTLEAARQVVKGVVEAPQAIAYEAADNLQQLSNDAVGTTPSADRFAEFFVRSTRNLAIEIIRRAYKLVTNEIGLASKGVREGAWRAVGGVGGTYCLAMLIKLYEIEVRILIDTMGHNPTLHKIVDLIVRMVS